MSAIHYGILDDASDDASAPLWVLTWRSTTHVGGRATEVHPERTIAELRPELRALLREGHVELYRLHSDSPALDVAAADAIVGDDAYWTVPSASGREANYAVMLTESGDGEYCRLADLHRGA